MKKTEMDKKSAARIQSHADRTGTNQDFKARAQSSADKRADQPEQPQAQDAPKKGQSK